MTRAVKCLVWDLDDTLWDGVVLERDRPVPFPAAVSTLKTLDERGILHAVAGRGERGAALAHLAEHGLDDLFTVIEVSWGSKAEAVRRVARTLNIGLESIAFIDNDAAERAAITHELPMVRCHPAEDAGRLPALAGFTPDFVTAESRDRRRLYRLEQRRQAAEADHWGPPADFLAWLDLTMTVRPCTETDLERAHELTVRTHQLNTTGRTFGADELRELCHSPEHEVLVASLRDRFGSYGTIGLAVTRLSQDTAVIELLLTSCRVMSRGAGRALIDQLVARALAAGRRPLAEFVPTPVNRIMLVTLRFAGFQVIGQSDRLITLAIDPTKPVPSRIGHVRGVSADRRA